jgi:hypothetical protein
LLGDGDKGYASRVEDFDDLGKVGKGAGEAVGLVDHDHIDPTTKAEEREVLDLVLEELGVSFDSIEAGETPDFVALGGAAQVGIEVTRYYHAGGKVSLSKREEFRSAAMATRLQRPRLLTTHGSI